MTPHYSYNRVELVLDNFGKSSFWTKIEKTARGTPCNFFSVKIELALELAENIAQ